MKIAHYAEGIWDPGGVASYIRRVAHEQRALGHEVIFFDRHEAKEVELQWRPLVAANGGAIYRQCANLGVDVLHLHRVIDVEPPSHLAVVRTLHGHEPYCPSGSQFLQRRDMPCGRTFSFTGCLRGHFLDHCGSIRPKNLARGFQITRTEMATLRQIPIITVSDFLKRRLIDAGYAAEQICTLYLMAPEVCQIKPLSSTEVPHFVFLGRLTPLKGAQWLVQAVSRVKPPIHVDIAGAGYYENRVRSLVEALRIGDRVTFHGWVDQSKVSELLSKARALVFPSLWHEPGGTVAFEAMAHGRPVIMSRVGGMPEVVEDDVTGLLVDPGNVDQLAAQITRLAEEPDFAATLGQAGHRRIAQSFTTAEHTAKLMEIYGKILEAKRNPLMSSPARISLA